MSDLQGESSNFENRTTAIVADTGWYGLNDLMLNIHAPGVLGGPAPSVTVDGLLRPQARLRDPARAVRESEPVRRSRTARSAGHRRSTVGVPGWTPRKMQVPCGQSRLKRLFGRR